MAGLHGITLALITPFTDDKASIDESRLQAHIEHLIQAGVHGLVPGGSTGEFTALSRLHNHHAHILADHLPKLAVPTIQARVL